MSAGTLGRVDEFDETKDDWLQYVERLEHFLAANGIDDANKKRAVLLTVVGAATYKTLRNIVSPKKPGEKTYAELVAALSKHFRPIYSLGNCRTVQVSLSCAEGGRIDRYLRRRTSYAVGILQLRCDIERHATRSLGLRCERPSHSEATPRSVRPEVSEGRGALVCRNGCTEYAGTRSLVRERSLCFPQEVHKTSTSGASPAGCSSGTPLTCYRCGRKGHTSSSCKVDRNIECHNCHKRGHMQRACKSKGRFSSPRPNASLSQSVKFRMRRRERGRRERGGGFR